MSATDGVGTKLDLTNRFKKFDSIGEDLVAMCVNDLIVQGAKPLFFLDYIAIGKINLKKIKKFLEGILNGCKKNLIVNLLVARQQRCLVFMIKINLILRVFLLELFQKKINQKKCESWRHYFGYPFVGYTF